jgi:hypothetical protein
VSEAEWARFDGLAVCAHRQGLVGHRPGAPVATGLVRGTAPPPAGPVPGTPYPVPGTRS